MRSSPIGLMGGVIRLDPYDPAWAECFLMEAKRIREVLHQRIGQVEHMGSTAVPGMIAKPIIDLMAAVEDFEKARSLIPDIEALGYCYGKDDEIADRHYFSLKLKDGLATHHLSLAESESQFWVRQILFRNYLRAHPEWSREYADLKRRLSVKHAGDRLAYVEAKSEFIELVLEHAGEERHFL